MNEAASVRTTWECHWLCCLLSSSEIFCGVRFVAHLHMHVGSYSWVDCLHGQHDPDPFALPQRPGDFIRTDVEQLETEICRGR